SSDLGPSRLSGLRLLKDCTEVMEGQCLAPVLPDVSADQEAPSIDVDGLLITALGGMYPAEAVEGPALPQAVINLPEDCESLQAEVQGLLITALGGIDLAEAVESPALPQAVINLPEDCESLQAEVQGLLITALGGIDLAEAPEHPCLGSPIQSLAGNGQADPVGVLPIRPVFAEIAEEPHEIGEPPGYLLKTTVGGLVDGRHQVRALRLKPVQGLRMGGKDELGQAAWGLAGEAGEARSQGAVSGVSTTQVPVEDPVESILPITLGLLRRYALPGVQTQQVVESVPFWDEGGFEKAGVDQGLQEF